MAAVSTPARELLPASFAAKYGGDPILVSGMGMGECDVGSVQARHWEGIGVHAFSVSFSAVQYTCCFMTGPSV